MPSLVLLPLWTVSYMAWPEGSLSQNVLPTTAVATAEVAVVEETGTVTPVVYIIWVGIKLATPAATTLVGTYLVTREQGQ
ncbi:hypothetical protein GBA52_004923 [Prunus armeniaca]|nr:hypothetical protein GBA52_004923 [Prunus armeniaca]